MNTNFIKVDEDCESIRIDKFIAEMNESLSRTFIQKIIKDGKVFVNNNPVKASYKVCEGDEIYYMVPEAVVPPIEAEDIKLDIRYEDSDILIVNKPKDMVVHPAAGNYTGTLVNALMYHCKDSLSGINGVQRPGIVHRIDKNTSGLLVVCKNDIAHRHLAEQFKVHSITRRYYAVCCGVLKDDEGVINAPIGRNPNDRKKMAINYNNGRNAITHYKVLERFNGYTYIECRLETGRTHQIRVHMASIGHPLLGDEVYGGIRSGFEKLNGQTLHAKILGFNMPVTEEYREFDSELPQYFIELLEKLRNKK